MPPQTLPGSADSRNKFEDLSGVNIAAYANPYDALIEACGDDPELIQARYDTHRTTRNSQQKAKLLSPDFSGLILDPILQRIEDPSIEPGFKDPRFCLVFWARPPAHIKSMVGRIQQELLTLAPNLWLMPLERLHLTALEITHSLTSPEIKAILATMGSSNIATMTDYTFTHRTRLIKPVLSYDGAAVALSFLPAAGESLPSSSTFPAPTSSNARQEEIGEEGKVVKGRTKEDDKYTYHHLRRDLFNIARSSGVSIDSRYVVPSSHITVGRFLIQGDHDSKEKMKRWFEKIEEINGWLREEFWPKEGDWNGRKLEAEWVVGEEKGLNCREGALWYGGGETVRLGKGF